VALRAFGLWSDAGWLIQRHGHGTAEQARADRQDEAVADSDPPAAA